VAGTAAVLITESADNDNSIASDRGCVEIRWREDFFWIAVDFDLIVGSEDDDIVVNAEIRVVMVFVLPPRCK
jgi:hypothetical protein